MSPYWKDLSKVWNKNIKPEIIHKIITFDSDPHISDSFKLSENIDDHGGGMTNIPLAFN